MQVMEMDRVLRFLYYDQKDLAAKISAQLAKDIGWRDRGAKQRTDLAVLNGTKAPGYSY